MSFEAIVIGLMVGIYVWCWTINSNLKRIAKALETQPKETP